MWLNRNTIPFTKIPKAKALTVGGVQHPISIFTKWSEEGLNSVGLFTIVATGVHSRRYYKSVLVEDFESTPPTISYIAEDLQLADIQTSMIKDLEATANSKFNEATAGYTASEMSSWSDLEAEAISHQTTPLESGMLYDEAKIVSGSTDELMISGFVDALATKVLTNASLFKQIKSFISGTRKMKSLEIEALSTVEQCILYEKTPYEYSLTGDDELAGLGTEGDVIERYTNRVKEW